MLVTVIGAGGSGKSEYAENRMLQMGGKKRYYIATMEPFGEEGEKRIKRHRRLREGKGFTTCEIPVRLEKICEAAAVEGMAVQIDCESDVLLEDLSNLLANEIWSCTGRGAQAGTYICQGIERLADICRNLIVVTNDIYRDGEPRTKEMLAYTRQLGELNRWLADRSDEVVEVVYGIPLKVKRKDQKG